VKYSPDWDLSTIPESELNSEVGRRRRAKGPSVTNVNLKPCAKCGESLNATQRRKACSSCGYTHPR
jgi:ribosomal protein S27AE